MSPTSLIPTLFLDRRDDAAALSARIGRLRLHAADLALARGPLAEASAAVTAILEDVARRGDDALVDVARKFDDPAFTADRLRVTPDEMKSAASRIDPKLRDAIRRAIDQVRQYQAHVMPHDPPMLDRGGVKLGLRFTPLDSAGLYFPGGKASYPSSLIHLAVPAQVAGVKRIVCCTPGGKYGQSDVVLAAAYEVGVTDVFRVGGAAAIAAMAFGTSSIQAVDKIVGPGNTYVQLAKRLVSGGVAVDGFLGPSEILVVADDTANPAFVAADMLAQAEHDPGSCFLLTTSADLARRVVEEIAKQSTRLKRIKAIESSLKNDSVIVVGHSMDELLEYGNQIAAEHVNLQVKDEAAVLARLRHAGAIFVGPHSPVAAGDYVAGPSHCLPTNTTARFGSGVSVYEFLKRTSLAKYSPAGIAADAPHVVTLAEAESLDAHAASAAARVGK
jgi:histidinol dehydrogenase